MSRLTPQTPQAFERFPIAILGEKSAKKVKKHKIVSFGFVCHFELRKDSSLDLPVYFVEIRFQTFLDDFQVSIHLRRPRTYTQHTLSISIRL